MRSSLDQFVATGIVQIEGTHAVSHERLEMSWTQGDSRTYIRDGRFTANNRGTQWFSSVSRRAT